MKPAHIDWSHGANEQFKFRVVLTTDAVGTPFDLSAYDGIVMMVKSDAFQPEADLTLTLGTELTLESGGTNGALNGVKPQSAIADMVGTYIYDVRGTTTAGRAEVILEGEITFKQGVTV